MKHYFSKDYYTWVIALMIITSMLIVSLTFGSSLLENKKPILESFIIINFLGYLFFLMMPIEGLFIYYLTLDFHWYTLTILALITSILAQIVNYYIGSAISKKYLVYLFGRKKYEKRKEFLQKNGNWIIFLFSLSVLSSPIIVLFAGFVRCKLKDVLIFSFLGLIIKYLAIVIFYLVI